MSAPARRVSHFRLRWYLHLKCGLRNSCRWWHSGGTTHREAKERRSNTSAVSLSRSSRKDNNHRCSPGSRNDLPCGPPFVDVSEEFNLRGRQLVRRARKKLRGRQLVRRARKKTRLEAG